MVMQLLGIHGWCHSPLKCKLEHVRVLVWLFMCGFLCVNIMSEFSMCSFIYIFRLLYPKTEMKRRRRIYTTERTWKFDNLQCYRGKVDSSMFILTVFHCISVWLFIALLSGGVSYWSHCQGRCNHHNLPSTDSSVCSTGKTRTHSVYICPSSSYHAYWIIGSHLVLLPNPDFIYCIK